MTSLSPQKVERRLLGEVCTLQRGFDLPVKERKPGNYPLVTSSGPTDFHSEARVRGPGVVTGRSGSIGNVFYVEDSFWPLNTALYVKDFHGNDPRYIFYLLQFFDLGRFASGAGVPTLNRNHVHDEAVWIATDLDEQKRIVAVLDQAFAAFDRARALAEANLADAGAVLATELNLVFEKGLATTARVAFDAITSDTLIGLVRGKNEQSVKFDYQYIKMQDIGNDDRFLGAGLSMVNCSETELQRFFLKKGDFLFNTRNSRELVGKSCLIEEDFARPTVYNNNIMRVRFKPSVDPRYVALACRAKSIKEQLEAMKSGTTSVVAIYHKSLKNLMLPLPDLGTQETLASRFATMDRALESVTRAYRLQLRDLDNLRQSFLQKAFAGELT